MKTDVWIAASLSIVRDNADICMDCFKKGELLLLLAQLKSFRKCIDSFITRLEAWTRRT